MAKVITVKKSQKDYPEFDIKKGDTYYQWKFRFGGVHKSLTYPKPQQLTQSEFQIALYDFQDRINALVVDDTLVDEVSNIIDEIRSFADEQEEKLNNMPEGLQQGDVGQLLQERYDSLSSWSDELEVINIEIDEDEIKETAEDGIDKDEKDRTKKIEERIAELTEEKWQEILDEIQACDSGL